MIWFASVVKEEMHVCYVEAERWFDARRVAMRLLGTAHPDMVKMNLIQSVKQMLKGYPIYQTRWVGLGYNGTLQFEMKHQDEKAWQRV